MKKKTTYADQAKAILAKYEKRLGKDFTNNDKLAKDAMNRELTELKNKQESFKMQQQQTEADNVLKRGGKLPTYEGTERHSSQISTVDENMFDRFNTTTSNMYANAMKDTYPILNTNDTQKYAGLSNNDLDRLTSKEKEKEDEMDWATNPKNFKLEDINERSAEEKRKELDWAINSENFKLERSSEKVSPEGERYNPEGGGISPLPLAANIAGNAIYANNAKNPEQVNYDRVRPQEISLARDREAAKIDAERARLLTLRNARGLGLNAGATATMGIGSLADINKVSGERIGKSYLNEEIANAKSKGRASRINAQLSMREKDANLREKDMSKAMKNRAVQNIIQGTGQYFNGVQKAKRFNASMDNMPGTANQFVDPDQNDFNRAIFGQKRIVDHSGKDKYASSTNAYNYWENGVYDEDNK